MKTRLRQYFTDNRGAVAIMTALALIPILLAIGGAIDYARIMSLRARLQQATDSAALAALAALNDDPVLKQKISAAFPTLGSGSGIGVLTPSQLNDGKDFIDYQAVAKNYIEQNFNSAGEFSVSTTTSADWANGTMTVSSRTAVPTFLLGLAGVNRIDLSADATAAVGGGVETQEIAIAFDTTFSMNFKGRKEAAVQAAKDFIVKVMNYPSGMPNPNVSVALVPFNDYVNVGPKSFWEARPIGVSWLTSTDDIVQKFPEVCWEAKTTTNRVEKTICTPYASTCTDKKCTWVPATCWGDGESYECATQTCEPVSYACTQQDCKGTGEFETTTTDTPAGCTPAYEIRTQWTGCVGSRDSVSDEIDRADAANKVSAVFSVGCPSSPIIFLSRNLNQAQVSSMTQQIQYKMSVNGQKTLIKALDNITFSGTTYIAPGLLWAWRALSPEPPVADWKISDVSRYAKEWPGLSKLPPEAQKAYYICGQAPAQGNFYDTAATSGLQNIRNYISNNIPGCPYQYAKKSIILMTDGLSTKSASYDDMGRHEKTERKIANEKLARICNNIKAAGIKIYTIAFTVNDSDTLATLTSCASDASSYFDAADAANLANAFRTIGSNFTRLRLIK